MGASRDMQHCGGTPTHPPTSPHAGVRFEDSRMALSFGDEGRISRLTKCDGRVMIQVSNFLQSVAAVGLCLSVWATHASLMRLYNWCFMRSLHPAKLECAACHLPLQGEGCMSPCLSTPTISQDRVLQRRSPI